MAGIGLVHGIVHNLSTNLQSAAVKDFFKDDDHKCEINLFNVVNEIGKLLVQAESKMDLPRYLLVDLRECLYDADDILDEIVTLANLRLEQTRISIKVRRLLSGSTGFPRAFSLYRKANRIREKLDVLATDLRNLCPSAVFRPVPRREETSSYAYEGDIIGRDDDLKQILSMLLDSAVKEDVSFLSIVGIGGLGKTALAQLVYNNPRVREAFNLSMWVCVSDIDRSESLCEKVLGKIAATANEMFDGISGETLESRASHILKGKKYLLFLDDVWCENSEQFAELEKILRKGARGSRVVITTRSSITAQMTGSLVYYLKLLSEEASWSLFQKWAFGSNEHETPELYNIGRQIVRKCCDVPLSIKVIGSYLYGQSEQKWQFFRENGLAPIFEGDDRGVMDILKRSYNDLTSPLKSCFSYCAVFPKNFVFKKEQLISLWIAQGYISLLDDSHSLEDIGENYFSTLLQRSFFQDVRKDEFDEVFSFTIHDLIHDIAREVVGEDINVVSSLSNKSDAKFHHLFHAKEGYENWTPTNRLLRSYLHQDGLTKHPPMALFVEYWLSLRVLDLHGLDIEGLPRSIGKLRHLRYLDLSNNALTNLPNSIGKLYNLQTLYLSHCKSLKELPKHLTNLISLRCLDLRNCDLTHMPSGLDKLTYLRVLTEFVVAGKDLFGNHSVGQLQDLKALLNLRGSLSIKILKNADFAGNIGEGGYIESMKYLNKVYVEFSGSYSADSYDVKHEDLFKTLQPPSALKALRLTQYQGKAFPRWANEDNWVTLFPNLVRIDLISCSWLEELPSFSKLPHLKSLVLHDLKILEYMEDSNKNCNIVVELPFYPSLECLEIKGLMKLKGWWRGVALVADQLVECKLPTLSNLSSLHIQSCPELTLFPPCPNLEKLHLSKVNEKLQFEFGEAYAGSRLKFALLDNMEWFKILPTRCLEIVHIKGAKKLENFSEFVDVFRSCSALLYLKIDSCCQLSRLSEGLEYLSSLKTLVIRNCPKLTYIEEEDDKNSIPWRALQHNLQKLVLVGLDNMSILPCGMQHLTSLQRLTIDNCGLEALPSWIESLSSLQCLSIENCLKLKSFPEELHMFTSLKQLEIENVPCWPEI
ncbi:unnamed protein product [Amaranthus hypochondriacus]